MHKRYFLGGYRLLFGLLALAAVVVQLSHQIPKGSAVLINFFSFFTIESNILAIGLFLVLGIATLRGTSVRPVSPSIRGAITLYMSITGIIYVLLLSGLDESLQTTIPWVNTVVHYIMPAVVVADWFIDLPRKGISFTRAIIWLSFPLAYLAYSLIRGHATGWYPYPFLNVGHHGYLQVLTTCAIITAGFCGLAWLLARTSRLRHI
jgi:hypothetical protein